VLWLQPANRVTAGATTWSEDSPGQSPLVERMPITSTPSRQTTIIMKITSVRREGRSEMDSMAGPACARTDRPKAANVDLSLGSAACKACSIWLSIRCWRRGRVMSCPSGARWREDPLSKASQ
jgi:hypothetical protein